jgi:predicted O-methyltransferase YrrM
VAVPERVARATGAAGRMGFTMSCEPGVGALLAVLSAAVPGGGRILELGTGAGVGTAWIVHGLAGRTDVEVVSVDNDEATASIVGQAAWPAYVRFVLGDAIEVTAKEGWFDLIFADAQGGKWDGLEVTLRALDLGVHLMTED